MAIGLEEFVEKTGAEIVADNIVVGVMADRRVIGSLAEGVFTLNMDGQEIAAKIESGTKPEKALSINTANFRARKQAKLAGKKAELVPEAA